MVYLTWIFTFRYDRYTVSESTDLVYMLVKDVWYTYSLGLMCTADVSFTFMIYVLRIDVTVTTSPARAGLSKTMPRTLTLSKSIAWDGCLLLLLIWSLWGTSVCCRVNWVWRFARAVEKVSVFYDVLFANVSNVVDGWRTLCVCVENVKVKSKADSHVFWILESLLTHIVFFSPLPSAP